jgi:RND family efflux transporter MFP subunit
MSRVQSIRAHAGTRWESSGLALTAMLLLAACHHSQESAATGPPAAIERLVVSVVQPVAAPPRQALSLPATVEAFEQATLYAKVTGYLERINVDKGDPVRRGALLARLEVPEVGKQYESAVATLEDAEAQRSLKQTTYDRLLSVRKAQPDVLAQQDVDVARSDAELAKARRSLARAEVGRLDALRGFADITAPFAGVITARYVDPGALIQQGAGTTGTPVVSIANIDTVRVYVNVPEGDVAQVDRSKIVFVQLDALPGKRLAGRITRVTDALDPATRTMKTEIDLPNPGHRMLSGMFGTAQLPLTTADKALFVPAAAIRHDIEGQPFVFVVDHAQVHAVTVETGAAQGGMVGILQGLTPGMQVVVSATGPLTEGIAVGTVSGGS